MKASGSLHSLLDGFPLERASELEGKPVKDNNGKIIGTVTEVDLEHDVFIVDLNDPVKKGEL